MTLEEGEASAKLDFSFYTNIWARMLSPLRGMGIFIDAAEGEASAKPDFSFHINIWARMLSPLRGMGIFIDAPGRSIRETGFFVSHKHLGADAVAPTDLSYRFAIINYQLSIVN
ncbi:MAG: hypothetical protein Fur0025_43040 [Oscillatoriaceae cyanobacterium]